jgi:hypothetical protein
MEWGNKAQHHCSTGVPPCRGAGSGSVHCLSVLDTESWYSSYHGMGTGSVPQPPHSDKTRITDCGAAAAAHCTSHARATSWLHSADQAGTKQAVVKLVTGSAVLCGLHGTCG